MKINQKGIGHIAVVVLIAVITGVGATGYFVAKHSSSTSHAGGWTNLGSVTISNYRQTKSTLVTGYGCYVKSNNKSSVIIKTAYSSSNPNFNLNWNNFVASSMNNSTQTQSRSGSSTLTWFELPSVSIDKANSSSTAFTYVDSVDHSAKGPLGIQTMLNGGIPIATTHAGNNQTTNVNLTSCQ